MPKDSQKESKNNIQEVLHDDSPLYPENEFSSKGLPDLTQTNLTLDETADVSKFSQEELQERVEQQKSTLPKGRLFSLEANEEIVELPEFAEKKDIDVTYDIFIPYSSVHIHWDSLNHELVYEINEPVLDSREKEVFTLVEEGIRELINLSFLQVHDNDIVLDYLEQNVRIILTEFQITVSNETFKKVMYFIWRNFVGLNEIEVLMHDYYVEDVECNGINSPIYIVHRKYHNMRTSVVFSSNEQLSNFVEKLAQKAGQYVSYASPLLDGRLPDGSRVNATFSADISTRGPTFTIRRFTKIPWTPIKLMEFRTVSPEVLAYLWLLVEYGSNIIVIGATASGKTSFLNALAFFIPPSSRVVTIEDTKELNLLHENWLPSVSRSGLGAANILGQRYGEVSLFDLLRESFRQRPDYVIVGEIRGKEAFVMFQGAASGHPTISTMHADSVDTLIRRLETAPIELSPSLIESLDAVCILGQAKVDGKLVRRLSKVVEIVAVDETGHALTNTPLVRDPTTDRFFFKTDSVIFDRIVTRHGVSKDALNKEFLRRAKLLYALYKNKLTAFKDVHNIISDYYKTPEEVLRRFGIE